MEITKTSVLAVDGAMQRLLAPTPDLIQGTGVPAAGAFRRLRGDRPTAAEPDSAARAPVV